MNEWGWVLIGCALGIMLSVVCFFCMIKQRDDLQIQVKELTEMINEHEEIMRTYEFFNKTWERLYNKENQEDFEK